MTEPATFRSYEGRGRLEYDNGQSIECAFVAAQEEDGGIELSCKTLEPGMPALWLSAGFGPRSKASRPSGLTGVTVEGAKVMMTGSLIDARATLSTAAPSEVTFILTGNSRFECGSSDHHTSEYRFAAANLVFSPVFIGEGVGTLPIEIDGVQITLRQLADYEDREKALRRSHGVRVTAEIRIPAAIGFDSARLLASDLCDLCSVARGTLVNWICCDAVDADGHRTHSYHFPAVTRPYAEAKPLIDPHTPLDLKAFIEACFTKYRELRTTREFRTVVHAACEARAAGFLDTRSLVCVSLLEHILGKDAVLHGEATLIDPDVFEVTLPSLASDVERAVRRAFPDAGDDQIQQITNHVHGFNWSSPRRRLKRAAARLGFTIPKQEIEALLATRNDLVHRLQFHTKDRFGEYSRLVWVLDTLILGLLGYEGVYLDARNLRRTRVKNLGGSDGRSKFLARRST